MERAWRWVASAFAVVMCVVAGVQASVGGGTFVDSFTWRLFFYIIPAIFYLAFAFGYLRVRDNTGDAGRWLILLLLIALMQSLALWSRGWESSVVSRATLWFFLVAVLLVGFRGLAIADGVSPSGAWFRRLRVVPTVLLGLGAALVISSLFLQVTLTRDGGVADPLPAGWRLLLRQVLWVTAEIGLTRDIDDLTTGIPGVAFDVAGYALYAVAILAALGTLVWLVRTRFSPARLRSSPVLPIMGAVTMLSALCAVSDIYWGWQFNLDRVRWASWLGFACWIATLGFGFIVVLRIARSPGGNKNLCNLMLFQVPLALFNFHMVPEYIYYSLGGGIFSVPLAGLGLLLLGLQIESWAYAALLLGRETAVRSNHETSARKEHVQSHRVRLTAMTQCSEQYRRVAERIAARPVSSSNSLRITPLVTVITDSLARKDTLLRVLRGSRDRMSFLRFPPLMDSRRDVAGGGV